jgi:hypothetical protein
MYLDLNRAESPCLVCGAKPPVNDPEATQEGWSTGYGGTSATLCPRCTDLLITNGKSGVARSTLAQVIKNAATQIYRIDALLCELKPTDEYLIEKLNDITVAANRLGARWLAKI